MKTAEDRFWDKVDKSGDCWVWTGYRNKTGYGKIGAGGKIRGAHRFIWELTYGSIPPIYDTNGKGLEVCHTCDNPACVRIEHLWLGFRAENMKDARIKGRINDAPGRTKSAVNRKNRTHCNYGHEFTTENIMMHQGYRLCRTCHNARSLASYHARKNGANNV